MHNDISVIWSIAQFFCDSCVSKYAVILKTVMCTTAADDWILWLCIEVL